MARKHCVATGIILLSLCCLMSCGLEPSYVLDYVPDSSVYMTDISATIRLPSGTAEGYDNYFTHFVIFYRIYISGIDFAGIVVTGENRSSINPTLNSDFNSIYPNTDKTSTTVNTSNLESYFFGRRYYRLTLQGADINSVLSGGSLGNVMEIFFPTSGTERPRLSIGGGTYTMRRAVDGPGISFRPLPEDRYFLNHPDLYSSTNATNEINADVATRTQTDPASRYTYVSMYIVAVGKDYLTTMYSQPTYLGTFKLADAP